MASLKKLASVLKVSEGFLKGLQGDKKEKADLIRLNTANCCRSIAMYTGYRDLEHAKKAITRNIKLLFLGSSVYANRLQKLANRYGKVKKGILLEAANAIKSNNFTEYNRLIKSNKELKEPFKRSFLKSIKKALIEKLRVSDKTNRATAKSILKQAGSQNGYKIIVPDEQIEKEIQKRLKRYGAVASLFWHAAKQINPKIKPSDGKNTLSKEKRKKHRLKNGMSYKTDVKKNEVSATVNHNAEQMNKKFKSKLLKRIASQEKFWAGQAEKQIIAAKVLNRLINEV